MPGLKSETFGTGDQSWLGSTHGIYNCQTVTLDVSAFTAATHYPDGYIRSGQPIDVADPGAAKPFADAAGAVLAFLYTDQTVDAGATQIVAPALRHGFVKVDKVPGGFTAPVTAASSNFVFEGGVS